MSFETYLVEDLKQINGLLLQADLTPDECAEHLRTAAAIGCRTLRKLCDDPELRQKLEQFADVRIITSFMMKESEHEQRRRREILQEFKAIIENPEQFKAFLELERELLIKGGVPQEAVNLIIEAIHRALDDVKNRAKPPDEVIAAALLLRDRSCLLSDDLKASVADRKRWGNVRAKIKIVMIGIGGAAVIGLDVSALAASVGITTAGSTVSSAIGGGIISGAAAELMKPMQASA